VLEDIHLDVQMGQTIALVGDSGSGKTTLIIILASLYPATSGEVTVVGRPLNEYTLEEYREQIAYVPQSAYVFDGSIRENIAYGKEIGSFKEVVKAAGSANAESFILQKPDQYETHIGERGIQLSGGERQRLAIARAIYKNADILLLDEATSSLDGESELAIQQTLDQLMRKHTCVVVAHRLSTITGADCIYFMRGGKIIRSGRHEHLLATCPEYEELYCKKFQSQAM
jgi:ATP-binding cassette subfamily B protein